MGTALSTPADPPPLSSLFAHGNAAAGNISSDHRTKAHHNLVLAWASGGAPVHVADLESFSPAESIIVLRLFEEDPSTPLPISQAANSLWDSAQSSLNLEHLNVPLNVTDREIGINDGSLILQYRVLVWSGRAATSTDVSIAERDGFRLSSMLAAAAPSTIRTIESIWRDIPKVFPFANSDYYSSATDMNDNLLIRALCGPDDADPMFATLLPRSSSIPSPSVPKKTFALNMGRVGRDLSPAHTARSSDTPMTMRRSSELSEEQLKLAQLEYFGPLSSEITPNLFLSGDIVASSLSHLQSRGITHIVNAAADACRSFFPDRFTYLALRLLDSKHEDIMCRIYDVIEFIDAALRSSPDNNVLIHCHRGVSRSATLAIAYVMVKHKLSFQAAFDHVKSRRDIVSPNIGFTVSLMQWHARMHGSVSSSPVAYRVVPFRRDPLVLVAKLVPIDGPIDSRGVFLFQASTAVYLWRGTGAHPRLHRFAERVVIPRLQRYEMAPALVIDVQQGEEPPEFLAMFSADRLARTAPNFSDGTIEQWTEDYQAAIHIIPRLTSLPLSGSVKSAPATVIGCAQTARPVAAPARHLTVHIGDTLREHELAQVMVPVQPSVDGDSDGDDEEDADGSTADDGGERAPAQMYSWPDMMEIDAFGPEDLAEREKDVVVFVDRSSDGRSAKIHVWIGADVEAPEATLEEFAKQVGRDVIQRLHLGDLDTETILQEADEETDDFWDMF